VILIQASEAERTWEAIKDTTSPAVLNAFIARHKDTRFADLARARLEKIDPKQSPPPASALSVDASAEEMIAELPVDREMLRLLETHKAFRTGVTVVVDSYSRKSSTTEVHGGYRTTMTTDEKTSVRVVRGGLIRLEQLQNDTITQANVTSKYTRQILEIRAANGLLELASTTKGVGRPGSDQKSTLIRLQNIEGELFPLQRGSRLSFEAVYRQVDATAPEQFTTRRSCEIVDDQDAGRLHPKLSGRAYVMNCRYHLAYRRSKRYTGNLGIHTGSFRMIFIAGLGVWLDATGEFTLKDFRTR
jgi:hypothetical protein